MSADSDGELRTERLRLRPLRPADAADMAGLLGGDGEAVRMTERLPDPCTEEAARAWIERRREPGQRVFAIERAEDGAFIGCMGFMRDGAEAGLGYWIGRPHWNRGYATEAGRAVLDHAQALGVRTVEAETFPENAASARVLEKLGFAFAGRTEKDVPERGGRRELRRYRKAL